MRRILLLTILCAVAALSATAHAHPAPAPVAQVRWGFVGWQLDYVLTEPRVVTSWGDITLDVIAELPEGEPDHGTINYYAGSDCWIIELRSGDYYQKWERMDGCYRIHAPLLGRLWAP